MNTKAALKASGALIALFVIIGLFLKFKDYVVPIVVGALLAIAVIGIWMALYSLFNERPYEGNRR